MRLTLLSLFLMNAILVGSVNGAVVDFILTGPGGVGLTSGSQPFVPSNPGRGGMGLSGISFDTVKNPSTNLFGLSLDIQWSNLSSNVTAAEIRGDASSNSSNTLVSPTVLVNLFSIATFNPSPNGGYAGLVDLTEPTAMLLLNGNTYINISTVNNPTGEIRGQLVAVPEPAGFTALAMVLVGCLTLRHRKV